MASNQEIGEAFVRISARFDDLEKSLDRLDKDVKNQGKSMQKSLGGAFKKIGAIAAAAFATSEIIAFGKEAVSLAGKLEGVEAAFQKLNNPLLLADLRKATRGTVNDLVLMQAAVRADNFKVPLNKLAGFFEFATKRASQTGESVDYLVNSIIDGIGRKSSLVLDNLGISATELQTEIKKVGDFGEAAGNIIERELGKMGDVAETSAQKMARINAQFENLQIQIGTLLLPVLEKAFNFIEDLVTELQFMANTDLENQLQFRDWNEELRNSIDYMKQLNDQVADGTISQEERKKTLEGLINAEKSRLKVAEEENKKAKETTEWAGRTTDAYKDAKETYETTTSVIATHIKRLELYQSALNDLTKAKNDDNTATKIQISDLEKYQKVLNNLDLSKPDIDNMLIGMVTGGEAEKVHEAIKLIEADIEDLGQAMDELDADPWPEGSLERGERFKALLESTPMLADALGNAFARMGDALVSSLFDSETALGRFAGSMASVIINLISQMLAASMANAITGATGAAAAAGPFAPAVLPATIATMLAAVGSAFASIPAFATGGQSHGGMAMVGENGPELVNLPKGAMVTPNHALHRMGGQTGNMTIGVAGVLRGDNIFLSNSRTSTTRTRTGG